MQHNLITFLLFALCASCQLLSLSWVGDSSNALPEGVVVQSSALDPQRFFPDSQGNFPTKAAYDYILDRQVWPYVVERATETYSVYSGKRDLLKSWSVIAAKEAPTMDLRGRLFFAVGADFGLQSSVGLSVDATYSRVLEIEVSSRPGSQWALNHQVNPRDLMSIQNNQVLDNSVVIWSRHLICPEVLFEHTLSSSSSTAQFPIVLKASAGQFRESRSSLGGQFVVRRFQNPEAVRGLLSSRAPMFVPAKEDAEISRGSSVSAINLVFLYGDKKWCCSREYALHADAEGLVFDPSGSGYGEGVERPKSDFGALVGSTPRARLAHQE